MGFIGEQQHTETVFLYTNSTISRREIKQSARNTIETTKNLEEDLTKEIKELYKEITGL